MFAAYAAEIRPDDPLSGLRVADLDLPAPPTGWVGVNVRAASVNHHDVWSLRGVGLPAERLPMVLGCDAAGVLDDGTEVVVHSVIANPEYPDETLDPKRSLLSERHPGTFAERVFVPTRNILPKPTELTWSEAACLPTAWLTAYRMLATRSGLRPGDTVLVQGVGGGVATAAIALARVMGLRVWATSRDEAKAAAARELGAHDVFAAGQRLPEKVDAVMETVGKATWDHSLRSLKPGGTIVVSGSTTGPNPPADLQRVFFLQLSVVGSTMGTRAELERLIGLCRDTGIRPLISAEFPLPQAAEAIGAVAAGDVFGKIVLTAT